MVKKMSWFSQGYVAAKQGKGRDDCPISRVLLVNSDPVFRRRRQWWLEGLRRGLITMARAKPGIEKIAWELGETLDDN